MVEMKKVTCSMTAVFACLFAAGAFAEAPEFDAAPVLALNADGSVSAEAPVVLTAQTFKMRFDNKERAQEVLNAIAQYLGERLTDKKIEERPLGAELQIAFNGAPIEVWMGVFQKGHPLYYQGPVLTPETQAKYEQGGQDALKEMADYLQAEWGRGFTNWQFHISPKQKLDIIYSYSMFGKVGGHTEKINGKGGDKYEIASPFPVIIVGGFIPENVRRQMMKQSWKHVVGSREAGL
jgi:hypothetical protein